MEVLMLKDKEESLRQAWLELLGDNKRYRQFIYEPSDYNNDWCGYGRRR